MVVIIDGTSVTVPIVGMIEFRNGRLVEKHGSYRATVESAAKQLYGKGWKGVKTAKIVF